MPAAPESPAAKQMHQNRLSLIVRVVRSGNHIRANLTPRAFQKIPPCVPRRGLDAHLIPTGKRRNVRMAFDQPYAHPRTQRAHKTRILGGGGANAVVKMRCGQADFAQIGHVFKQQKERNRVRAARYRAKHMLARFQDRQQRNDRHAPSHAST